MTREEIAEAIRVAAADAEDVVDAEIVDAEIVDEDGELYVRDGEG